MTSPEHYSLIVHQPRTRGECAKGSRPCPWIYCRYHLGESNPVATCTLDVADRGGATLEEVGDILNLTRERIRQIEHKALHKLWKLYKFRPDLF